MKTRAAAIAAVTSLALATPALAGPSINTGWKALTTSQPECVEKARSALGAAGLDRLQSSQISAFAQQGDYSATIRCIPERGVVVFVVAGPQAAEASRLIRAIFERF